MVYNFKYKRLKLDNILQWYKFDQIANMEIFILLLNAHFESMDNISKWYCYLSVEYTL